MAWFFKLGVFSNPDSEATVSILKKMIVSCWIAVGTHTILFQRELNLGLLYLCLFQKVLKRGLLYLFLFQRVLKLVLLY